MIDIIICYGLIYTFSTNAAAEDYYQHLNKVECSPPTSVAEEDFKTLDEQADEERRRGPRD